MKNNINILVASPFDDDCNRIISSLSNQNDFIISGIEKDESGAIIKSEKLKPDVLIMDLHQSGLNGHELAPIILRRSPSTAIVIICDNDKNNHAYMALKAGVSGFLLREADIGILASVVRIVFSGKPYISSSISMNRFPELPEIKMNLSRAERGILKQIAHGLTDEEIAEHLNYSTGGIKNSITAIKRKTKLKSRVQIALFSIVYGFVSFDDILSNIESSIKN